MQTKKIEIYLLYFGQECKCATSNSNIVDNLILLHIFQRSSINEKKTLHPRPLEFSNEAEKIAENSDFQLAGYCFEADKESTRAPRVVRIGNYLNSQWG